MPVCPMKRYPDWRAILDRLPLPGRGRHHHAPRTRQAGAQRFVSVRPSRCRVAGASSEAASCREMIEYQVRQEPSPVNVITHLELVEDPASWVRCGAESRRLNDGSRSSGRVSGRGHTGRPPSTHEN